MSIEHFPMDAVKQRRLLARKIAEYYVDFLLRTPPPPKSAYCLFREWLKRKLRRK